MRKLSRAVRHWSEYLASRYAHWGLPFKISGKLSNQIKEKFDSPVLVADSNHQVIQRILPRKYCYVRNGAGNQD